MKKTTAFTISICFIILFLIGCTNIKQQNIQNQQLNTSPSRLTTANTELSKLLPYREGYEWNYNGFAEYGHTMRLKHIEKNPSSTKYFIDGTVADMSGGESKKNFNIKVTYIISGGILTQNKTEEVMMDSIFDSIQLIKTPLTKNMKWSQKTIDKEGKKYQLECQITDIRDEKGQKIFTVTYKDKKSDYYEKRQIKEGVGVISFEKLWESDGDSFTIGYALNLQATGYHNKLTLNSYLPPLNKKLRYFGLAEYAHEGNLKLIYSSTDSAAYEFNGLFTDGSGLGGTFKSQYIFNYINGTITEKVIKNSRKNINTVNSKLNNFVILKLPIQVQNSWENNITIDGKPYVVNAKIVNISLGGKTPYSPYISDYDKTYPIITVRYTVNNLPGYFNNTYIEERKFQTGRGMIGFSNLMKGSLGLSGKELEDKMKVDEAYINHMFGYSLAVNEL